MRRIVLTALLVLSALTAGAQRTSRGMSQVTLLGGSTLSHWGGELSYGQYLLRSCWMGAVAFHDRIERDAPSGETVHYPRLEGRGGLLYRLLSSYDRAVSLYVGGDAFIGVEMLDLFGTLSAPTRRALERSGLRPYQFIYGAAPRVELELFLSPSVALIAGGRAPFTFGSPLPLIGWELSLGGRVNF